MTVRYLAVGVLICWIGCKPASDDRRVTVFLLDRSASTTQPETRALYASAFSSGLSTTTHGDAIVAGWISDRSLAEVRLLVNEDFPVFDAGTDNSLILKGAKIKADSSLARYKANLNHFVDSLLNRSDNGTSKTDIFGSLMFAERALKKYHQGAKVLVICSDMIEDADLCNFLRFHFTQNGIQNVIERLRAQKLLPDLRGVRVYVVGATAPTGMKLLEIEQFWLAFFEVCGADLAPADYGASLLQLAERDQ